MKYAKILSISKINQSVFEVKLNIKMKLLPGNFISVVLPSNNEIPLGIGDYQDDILSLYVESEKIIKIFEEKKENKKEILIKGPLGNPLKLGNKILGIAKGNLYYDIVYPLRYAKRQGKEVKVICDCDSEFEKINEIKGNWDTIISSIPREEISSLPKDAYIYVRWVKMNCHLGVCGVCNINGVLPCIEGPFIKVEELVD
ncbi:2-polyprenylphenol hydroxylase [Acidianus sulfidivorans JP7]|uniref:2-polyprenylphenol hydroxylase n=1 Tax=Acidianus sulfidivorans JP7 TaxID=619593 RepID=A0A2U9INH6_9CREN|nr:2-polyprenylphenol hydroxylase [Acidianus sulfidivorans]AWR97573.1 2-polyprenylphenol hydroxylase [Acidianus sulfidivorans JP7]